MRRPTLATLRDPLTPLYAYRFFGACLPYLPVASACLLARGLSLSQTMALGTVYCLGTALLAIPLGTLADRIGYRRTLLAGTAALAAGALIASVASTLVVLVAAQLCFAVAGAIDGGIDSAWLYHLLAARGEAHRYRACEARGATFKLCGNVLGFAVGGALAALSPGAPFVAGALSALAAGACVLALADVRPGHAPRRLDAHELAAGARELLASAGHRRYVVLAALTAAMARVAMTTTGPYLASLDVPLVRIGLLTAAGAAAAALTTRRAVALADRFGERALLAALPVALVGLHLAMGLGGGAAATALALLPQVLAGLHAPLWRSHLNSGIRDASRRATVLAMDATFARLVYALFSSLLALLAADGGPRAALRGCTLLGAAALVLIAAVPDAERRRPVARRFRTVRLGWAFAGGFALLFALSTGPTAAKADRQPVAAAAGAVTTAPAADRFLGSDDDAALERLCGQPVAKLAWNPLGTSLKFKATLADGTRAALRPSQTGAQGYHRAEVASYRLSRALHLGTVPPTCYVQVSRAQLAAAERLGAARARLDEELVPPGADPVEASMTLWVGNVRDGELQKTQSAWRPLLAQSAALESTPAALLDEAAEGSRLAAWDFLIDNWDRWSGGNTFRAGARGPYVWLDNAAGFGRYSRAMQHDNERQLAKVERFSRRMISSLRALDDARLAAALAPAHLSPRELADLSARRAALLEHVNRLIAQYGELSVLIFE